MFRNGCIYVSGLILVVVFYLRIVLPQDSRMIGGGGGLLVKCFSPGLRGC